MLSGCLSHQWLSSSAIFCQLEKLCFLSSRLSFHLEEQLNAVIAYIQCTHFVQRTCLPLLSLARDSFCGFGLKSNRDFCNAAPSRIFGLWTLDPQSYHLQLLLRHGDPLSICFHNRLFFHPLPISCNKSLIFNNLVLPVTKGPQHFEAFWNWLLLKKSLLGVIG